MKESYLGNFQEFSGNSQLLGVKLYAIKESVLSYRPDEGEGIVEMVTKLACHEKALEVSKTAHYVVKTLLPHGHNKGNFDIEILPEYVLEKHRRLRLAGLNVTSAILYAQDTQAYIAPSILKKNHILFDKHVIEDKRTAVFRKQQMISAEEAANIRKKLEHVAREAFKNGVFLGVDAYAILFPLKDSSKWKIYLLDLGYGSHPLYRGEVEGYIPVNAKDREKTIEKALENADTFFKKFVKKIIR